MAWNRRGFGRALIGSVAGFSLTPLRLPAAPGARIVERRVYRTGSVVPPADLLARHGIALVETRVRPRGTEFTLSFASLASRTRAWDGFNGDADWRRLRDSGVVDVSEIAFGAA